MSRAIEEGTSAPPRNADKLRCVCHNKNNSTRSTRKLCTMYCTRFEGCNTTSCAIAIQQLLVVRHDRRVFSPRPPSLRFYYVPKSCVPCPGLLRCREGSLRPRRWRSTSPLRVFHTRMQGDFPWRWGSGGVDGDRFQPLEQRVDAHSGLHM